MTSHQLNFRKKSVHDIIPIPSDLKIPAAGSLHDFAVHGSNNGKRKPEYAKMVLHEDDDDDDAVLHAVAGTQSLDSIFGHAKNNVGKVQASRPVLVEHRLRQYQWLHWIRDADRWAEAGRVISWVPFGK